METNRRRLQNELGVIQNSIAQKVHEIEVLRGKSQMAPWRNLPERLAEYEKRIKSLKKDIFTLRGQEYQIQKKIDELR